jgi:hypothetical protein
MQFATPTMVVNIQAVELIPKTLDIVVYYLNLKKYQRQNTYKRQRKHHCNQE